MKKLFDNIYYRTLMPVAMSVTGIWFGVWIVQDRIITIPLTILLVGIVLTGLNAIYKFMSK